MLSSGLDAMAVGVDDLFAILLGEGAELRRGKNIEHSLGRAAEPDPQR